MSHITALADILGGRLDTTRPVSEQLIGLSTVFWEVAQTRMDVVRGAMADDDRISSTLGEELAHVCQVGDSLRARFLYLSMDYTSSDLAAVIGTRTALAGEVVRWEGDGETIRDLARGLAEDGELETLQWVCEQAEPGQLDPVDTCAGACLEGEQEVVGWMMDRELVDRTDPEVVGQLFSSACHGTLEMAQWVHQQCPTLDHHWRGDQAFANACETSLALAQWVYSLGGVDHLAGDGQPFDNACRAGLEVAQWVHSLGGMDHSHIRRVWEKALLTSNWEIASWIQTLGLDRQEVIRQCTRQRVYSSLERVRHLTTTGVLDPEMCDRVLEAIGQCRRVLRQESGDMATITALLVRAGANPLICDSWPYGLSDIRDQAGGLLADRHHKSARSG